jgi:ComEC/Rec2-related protein
MMISFDYKRFLRNSVTPTNLFGFFLVVVACLSLILSFGSSNTYGDNNRIFEVRITTQQKPKFGYRYDAWLGNSKVIINSTKPLEAGYRYRLEGEITKFQINNKNQYDNYSFSQGYFGSIKVLKVANWNQNCDMECGFWRWVGSLKYKIGNNFDRVICKDSIDIVRMFGQNCQLILSWSNGLVAGQGNLFSDDQKTQIKSLGLVHIVVASGSQIGLIAVIIEKLGILLRITKKYRIILAWAGIGVFALIIGFQAPVLRSSVSFVISSFGIVFFGRRLNQYRALLYSMVFWLLVSPSFVFSYSFWLSCVASFGVIMSINEDQTTETAWLDGIGSMVKTTLFAFLYTLPLIVNLSGKISVLTLLANVLVLPIIPFVVMFNLLTFVPYVGIVASPFVIASQTLLNLAVSDLSKWNYILAVESFGVWEMVVYWVVLSFVVGWVRRLSTSNNRQNQCLT